MENQTVIGALIGMLGEAVAVLFLVGTASLWAAILCGASWM